jgi:hypothetical protein
VWTSGIELLSRASARVWMRNSRTKKGVFLPKAVQGAEPASFGRETKCYGFNVCPPESMC